MRNHRILRTLAMVTLTGASACAYPWTSHDAGNGAWVEQVVPALLGRKPINGLESRVLGRVITQKGRSAAVDALMSTPEFDAYWSMVLADALKLQRSDVLQEDLSATHACWNAGTLYASVGPGQTGLADALSTASDARTGVGLGAFNMADVLRSAIAADDVFSAFRAKLFTTIKASRPRQYPAETRDLFLESHTNRKALCLQCHTSTSSHAPIAPIAVDLDQTLFPNYATTAVNIEYGLGVASGALDEPLFGASDTACASVISSWNVDTHGINPNPFPAFAGLNPGGGVVDVLDLDRALFTGKATLTTVDLYGSIATPRSPDYTHALPLVGSGDKAFAMAVALTATEAIIKELEGHGLTVAHGHPRVDEQRDYLQSYAALFVNANWSLRTLLRSLVLSGTFNMKPPNATTDAYPMPMFQNPWVANTASTPLPGENVNGVGDLVHRFSVPSLLMSVQHGLGWAAPKIDPASNDPYPTKDFQRELGRYQSYQLPGASAVTFQSLLAWDTTLSDCQNPAGTADWVTGLLTQARSDPTVTLRDVIVAMKDRLIQEPYISACAVSADPTDPTGKVASTDPTASATDDKASPSVRPEDRGLDWRDTQAVLDWAANEAKLTDVRRGQREAARAVAAAALATAAQEMAADPTYGLPPDPTVPDPMDAVSAAVAAAVAQGLDPDVALDAALEEAEPSWRLRFDAYAEQAGDAKWSEVWGNIRDQVSWIGASKALEAYNLDMQRWTPLSADCEGEPRLLLTYFGQPSLDVPVSTLPLNVWNALISKTRGFCGTLLTSPQFMLGGMRPPQQAADVVPRLLVCATGQGVYCDEQALCGMYSGYVSAHGWGPLVCP